MYVHAYQSYLWNLVVSERIKLSRTKPLVGDLVFDGDAEEKEGKSSFDIETRSYA